MSELAYEDIKTGDEASLSVTITETHIVMYAGLTGDVNPFHVDAEHAKESIFGERIAHGMLVCGADLRGAGQPAARTEFYLPRPGPQIHRSPSRSAIPLRWW